MTTTNKPKTHQKTVILCSLIAIVSFGAGYGTHMLISNGRPSGRPGDTNASGMGGDFENRRSLDNNQSSVNNSGTVVSKSDSYITIKLSNGNTQNVYIGSGTKLYTRSTIETSQLEAGDNISVTGTTNDDSNFTATSITVTE